VHDIIQSAFISAGQRCTCARRLYLPLGAEGDAILARLLEVTKALKVGLYDEADQPFMGTLISEKAALGMLKAQQDLVERGAQVLLSMQQQPQSPAMLSPGILDCSLVTDMPDEEHFGPLLKVFRFTDFNDAIKAANNTSFGLSAGLLSDDEALYQLFSGKSGRVLSTGTDLSRVRALLLHLVALAVAVIIEPALIMRLIIVLIRSHRWSWNSYSYRNSYLRG